MYPGLRPLPPSAHAGPHNLPHEYSTHSVPRPENLPPTLFRNAVQQGLIPLLYAADDNPLLLWAKQIRLGHIRRMPDPEFTDGFTLELMSSNNATTFITCPASPFQTLGVHLPIIIFHMKGFDRPFQFMVSVRDEVDANRRFLFGTNKETKKVSPFTAHVQLKLRDGWNEVRMDMAYYLRRLFGRTFKEINRIQITASCRLRMVCLTDQPEISHIRGSASPGIVVYGRNTPRGQRLNAPANYVSRHPEVDQEVMRALERSSRRLSMNTRVLRRGN